MHISLSIATVALPLGLYVNNSQILILSDYSDTIIFIHISCPGNLMVAIIKDFFQDLAKKVALNWT